MKRSKVERTARRMIDECGLTSQYRGDECFVTMSNNLVNVLAAWHLRELRKARGRALGYVVVSANRKRVAEPTIWDKPGRASYDITGSALARLVLIPRRERKVRR